MRIDDPWYDALATGGPEPGDASYGPPSGPLRPAPAAAQDVYPVVQRSAAFQQLRRRYRRFVLPVSAVFLLWYLGYLFLAVSAPGVLARPVAGVLNVGMAAGLAQFAATFLLAWLYARHARRRRDRLALELRWETQEMTRGAVSADLAGGTAAPVAAGEGGR
ncbi:DUF485 domain-containing protein [Streptomyces oryzae]|uniref:DUF485 domain-containing protein n=1 Tax=Streptomyces oryzae TaxID=1434886 RepID=A0ABS3X4D5_9ACTN|nr:DUF485 domain-containing protein [Streptomyces oryzae]MBO8190230.1 DUF485 domain-containing protein [Streptomyces oryzae]